MAKKILVVDDELQIRRLVKELLEDEGFKVDETDNGMGTLAILKKKSFDLILLDFFMPEMSGREVAERIRKNPKTKSAKLAFMTVAEFGPEGETMLKKLRILDYIKKPFDNEDFLKRVKKLVK